MFWSSPQVSKETTTIKMICMPFVWTWLLPCVHISLARATFGVQVQRPCVSRRLPCAVSAVIQTEAHGLFDLAPLVRSPHGSLTCDNRRGLSIFTSTCRCVTPARLKRWRGGGLVASCRLCSKAGLYIKHTSIHPSDAKLTEVEKWQQRKLHYSGTPAKTVRGCSYNQTPEQAKGLYCCVNLCLSVGHGCLSPHFFLTTFLFFSF